MAASFFILRWVLFNQQNDRLDLERPTERIKSEYGQEISNLSEWDLLEADEAVLFDHGIGVLKIPAIGLAVPVLEGDTEENLKLGAGTMKAEQNAGKGNYALAGHNMTNGLLFGKLPQAAIGQRIQLEAYQVKAEYVITQIFHDVHASRYHLIEDTEGEGLITLVTCNASGSRRFILRGEVCHGEKVEHEGEDIPSR